ncbi:MAG: hypothetical protein WKG07_40920 [Hymenobacter sp.]
MPSIGLGSAGDVSVYEMVDAYSTFHQQRLPLRAAPRHPHRGPQRQRHQAVRPRAEARHLAPKRPG